MMKLYQEALSESAKELFNSEAQVLNYVTQLGTFKVKKLSEQIVGKNYPSHFLLRSYKTYCGEYEKVDYKAVHVDFRIYDYNILRSIRDDESILSISAVFVRDPDVILDSKLKLTDAEKRILRKLKEYYKVKDASGSRWFKNSEVENLESDLSSLKHHIHAVIPLYWTYSLKDILSEDFPIKGIKAELSLTI